ncbi:transposase [Paenibacillus pasadenensis]|uniref:transposase n=1 Tax=Paenibacillus pasadenensis TaxID=217090 RepID=UPI00203BCEE7|nr:transposase [Paenibacillus pasadenensis]MCM3748487.1 transposase [Paenibacillus pasadenensis]
MSDKPVHNEMDPVSGEHVEVDGVYTNEWGREEKLQRGDVFPADPMWGSTEWKLTELEFSNHHMGHTDPREIPHDNANDPENHLQHPRRHKHKEHRGDN